MAKALERKVACPKCGRQQPLRSADSLYFCDNCRMQFDAEGDDGGDFFSDPSKRMELSDERRVQRKRRVYGR